MIPKVEANFSTSLAVKLSSSATTLTLNVSVDDDGATLNDTYFLTLSEGASNEEHMLVVLNGASGTITTRGLSRVDAATNQASNQFEHDRGASVKITNLALIKVVERLNGDEAFDSPDWTGVQSVDGLALPTAGETTKAASVAYVNNVAVAGAPDASPSTKGLNEMATSAESQTGTDTGSTTGPLVAAPSDIAANVQNQQHVYAADSGAADAYVVTLVPAPTTYAAGMRVSFLATNLNTGASTLNLNALGVKNILKHNDQALEAGDIEAAQIVEVVYDGTQFQLQTPLASNLTTAIANETATFFGSTDISGAEAETLTDGSDADALHIHESFARGWNFSAITQTTFKCGQSPYRSGFSDDTTKVISVGSWRTGSGGGHFLVGAEIVTDYGVSISVTQRNTQAITAVGVGLIYIGTDRWDSYETNIMVKNGASVTFASQDTEGALGHDPTNSYLLILNTSTNVRRFSGIAGTTLTFVDNITLDTAVDSDSGFFYDDTNSRYICVDVSANLIRRFDSSGTTIDTASYTLLTDNYVQGVCAIDGRVHLVCQTNGDSNNNATPVITGIAVDLIPTTMTI